jgi:2-phosphosulfolactate phosphatase
MRVIKKKYYYFSYSSIRNMKIEILEFDAGAKKATGITVIIDVFRAFSVACYAFDSGAVRLIVTDELKKAFDLKMSYKNAILTGERGERKIEGFDFGNSPTEILKSDLSGKTVIQTTTAGTNGLINAINADILLTGSIVNAGAVAKYIKVLNPENVSLVAMGYRGINSAEEDLLCAEMIRSYITGTTISFEKRLADLRYGSGSRFFDPVNLSYSPPTDFFLCTMVNRFGFVLKGERRPDGNIDLMKIDI